MSATQAAKALEELGEELLDCISEFVVRTAYNRRYGAPIAQEIGYNKTVKDVFDCYYFHHWVMNVPKPDKKKFKEELSKLRLHGDALKIAPRDGYVTKKIARSAFVLSAEFNQKTVEEHFLGYIRNISKKRIKLASLDGRWGKVDLFLKSSRTNSQDIELSGTKTIHTADEAPKPNLQQICEEAKRATERTFTTYFPPRRFPSMRELDSGHSIWHH